VIRNSVIGFMCAILASPALAASVVTATTVSGFVGDLTSLPSGLLIRMDDDQVPTNCTGAASSWMQISQSDTVMVSTFLTYWAAGKRSFTLYTNAWTSGYCSVGQVYPRN
jgi:hypothetical protein